MSKVKKILKVYDKKPYFYGLRENTLDGRKNFSYKYTDDINEVKRTLETFLSQNSNFSIISSTSVVSTKFGESIMVLQGNKHVFELSFETYKQFKESLENYIDELKRSAIEQYSINENTKIKVSLYNSSINLKENNESQNNNCEYLGIEKISFCCGNERDMILLNEILDNNLKNEKELVVINDVSASEYYLTCGANKLLFLDSYGIVRGIIQEYNLMITRKLNGNSYNKQMKTEG